MATASPKLPPLPAASEPVVMPDRTINPSWYAWFKAAEKIITILRTEVP